MNKLLYGRYGHIDSLDIPLASQHRHVIPQVKHVHQQHVYQQKAQPLRAQPVYPIWRLLQRLHSRVDRVLCHLQLRKTLETVVLNLLLILAQFLLFLILLLVRLLLNVILLDCQYTLISFLCLLTLILFLLLSV